MDEKDTGILEVLKGGWNEVKVEELSSSPIKQTV